jgi:hypothetical protein
VRIVVFWPLLATVVMVGNAGRNRTETPAYRNGAPPAAEMPHGDNELDLERGYLIAAMNARHALAGTLSVAPARFLVSRTITASPVLATSTHSPPFAPE